VSTTLLSTKLYIPTPRKNLVPRPRLIEQLDAGQDDKIILISAPAGFGKTTLLVEWIQSNEKLFAWLSLDEGDNNQKRFFTYLIAALQQIDETVGDGILPLLEATGEPPIEPLITTLINNLLSTGEEFYLVLDDYHLITNEEIHNAISFMLEHIPPNAHIVISGRVDPPITISRLRARDQMTEVRPNDLRFVESEGKTFLNDLSGLELSPEDISALVSRTEGWITGLQLAALSMQDRQDKGEFVAAFSGSHHYIIDYLVDEVVALQSDEVRSFLYRTSLLNRFCAPLCDTVLGISDSNRTIHYIDEANLFLIPLDDERQWYRYHHLFAEFLYQRLLENEPENVPQFHHQASIWFERNGFLVEAINHALEGKEFSRVAELVESVGPEMMMHSEFDQLASWLDAIPQEQVNSWPWLCIIRAWMCQRWAQFDEGEKYLQSAEQALKLETTPEPMDGVEVIRGQICALRSLFSLSKGQIPPAVEYANLALAYLPEGYFNRPVAADALGIALKVSGDYDGAIQLFGEARKDSLAVGNRILAQAITMELGITYFNQGKLYRAADTFREAISYTYQETQIKIPYASGASVYLAAILYEWNDLDEAMVHVEEGIQIGLQAKMVDAVTIGYGIRARVFLAQGDLEAALTTCQQAEKMMSDIPDLEHETIILVLDSRVRLLIAADKLHEASRIIQEHGLDVNSEIINYFPFGHLVLSRLLIHLGRENTEGNHLSDAADLLIRLKEIIISSGCKGEIVKLLILEALVFEAQDSSNQAVASLEEALSLAKSEGYLRTFVDEGEPMRELLRVAYSQGISKEYVSRLLAAYKLRQIRPKTTSQFLVEPLTDRELEVLKLLRTELTGPEIAQELSVSLNTLRTHTKNIYSKLSVTNRRAAVHKAEELDLF
jgi:LuxR family maltose regulon positive regulatory protein